MTSEAVDQAQHSLSAKLITEKIIRVKMTSQAVPQESQKAML